MSVCREWSSSYLLIIFKNKNKSIKVYREAEKGDKQVTYKGLKIS